MVLHYNFTGLASGYIFEVKINHRLKKKAKYMQHVFHRHTQANLPVAVQGDGCFIIDDKGKRYFDGSGGAAVSCLGHSNKEVQNAIAEQVSKIAYAHSAFFTTEPMEELADFLIDKAPEGLGRVYFVSGGSEAVEGALKLARQYFVEIGQPERRHVIARLQSYHGNTLGALSAGGNQWRRQQFEPLLMKSVSHISPCYEYREKKLAESAEEYGLRAANELEAEILRVGPEEVAAFIAEPVVGATLGCVAAVSGYFTRIREICDKYGVLLILDEVMCGMGRTGTVFACEQDGITADIITIAKGLGGGYQPIGALLASKKIYSAIEKGSGFFQHGHTYIGHATACAAALTVQKVIERDNLLDNVQRQGNALIKALHSRLGSIPYVGDIRGRGLFVGIELVDDSSTKTPCDPSLKINAAIKKIAMDKGLMCYAMGGTVDGKSGDHIMLAPPYIIEDVHIDLITDILHASIKEVLEQKIHFAA